MVEKLSSRAIWVLLAILVTAGISFACGQWVQSWNQGVCHSSTEDSVITDCNYENGTWTTK